MLAPLRCRLMLATMLVCAAAAAAAAQRETARQSRKLTFDPIQTCKNTAETCSTSFLPLFQSCCSGQGTTCFQGPVLDTTRCIPRPQPPTATIFRPPGNWKIVLKPKGLPASLAPQLFCSASMSISLSAKDPWAFSFSTSASVPGNSSFCLDGPQQTTFTVLPGAYKCGTKYDLATSMTFNFSDPALTSDQAAVPGKCNPITAPPCLDPAKWLLSIDEPTCSYRFLKTKECSEGAAGINVTATMFQASYMDRLFTIKPAPGHSGPLVGAGTPVNIIAAGRAGSCAANLASASNTCSAPGLAQSPNAVAAPSQWVLESAGKPGLVYIRSVARTKANCPARYLGVSKATCNMPYSQFKYGAASLFVKSSPGARTVWRLERA